MLEIELARLREGYQSEVMSMSTSLDQHKNALREHQEENAILKEMLTQRGINFQHELESRKAASETRNTSFGSGSAMQQPGFYNSVTSAPSSASGYSPQPQMTDRAYTAGRIGSTSGGSQTGSTQHTSSYSAADPGVFEQGIKREHSGIPDMAGGIFEKDPQLQVEFILA